MENLPGSENPKAKTDMVTHAVDLELGRLRKGHGHESEASLDLQM